MADTIQLRNDLQCLTPMEQARADFHALLAALWLRPPDAAFLAELGRADAIVGNAETALASAWEELVLGAALMDAETVRAEYERLFISVGNPLVNPYASFYLAGFLMDHPLASLRTELGRLGLARREGVIELEDHLGALLETMRVLIEQERPLAVQQAFFERHIASWYARLTGDVRKLDANFYRLVADFTDAFLALEAEGFAMSANGEQQ